MQSFRLAREYVDILLVLLYNWINYIRGLRMIDLYNGDCLDIMDKLIEDGIKVDAIITDPPYGTTACKWDNVIPFEDMWLRLNKLIKPNGAIVLFGSEPFSSALRMSNIKNYKYDWIWEKDKGANFATSRKQPLKKHEIISVFYKKQPYYDYKGIELDKKYFEIAKERIQCKT